MSSCCISVCACRCLQKQCWSITSLTCVHVYVSLVFSQWMWHSRAPPCIREVISLPVFVESFWQEILDALGRAEEAIPGSGWRKLIDSYKSYKSSHHLNDSIILCQTLHWFRMLPWHSWIWVLHVLQLGKPTYFRALPCSPETRLQAWPDLVTGCNVPARPAIFLDGTGTGFQLCKYAWNCAEWVLI